MSSVPTDGQWKLSVSREVTSTSSKQTAEEGGALSEFISVCVRATTYTQLTKLSVCMETEKKQQFYL